MLDGAGLAVLCPYGGGELFEGEGEMLLLPYIGGPPFEVETPGRLLLTLEMDAPREEVLGLEIGTFEEADDWRMLVTVPVEDPGTPPLLCEDTEIKVEALEPPGLL